ncbi:hypothetical protein EBU71_10875 [bacterium]|nr:hypothetical protein [Candidatus Elulimicrobium humile]
MRIAWSGLADSKYYHYIAKYCLPSWRKLPGDKYVIHDAKDIIDPNFSVIDWQHAYNKYNRFSTFCNRTKPTNFWRKMQSQIWALKNLKDYDFVVLMDTDVEVFNFNSEEFQTIVDGIKNSNVIWATGESQKNKLDAGHIVVNMKDSRLDELIFDYENIWESGDIFKLRRYYDGEAVDSLITTKYPSYKIKNTDHGGGLHTYTLGTVHYGSKIPKILRALWDGNTDFLVEQMISDKRRLSRDPDDFEELKKQLNERN